MTQATKRSILRWIHLVFSIPILGYIYSPFDQIPEYAAPTRFIFVPIMLLSGFWMYVGVLFAIVGVSLWVGTYYLVGLPAALLSQIALFAAWKIWSVLRRRRQSA
jgi:hypothetical protein